MLFRIFTILFFTAGCIQPKYAPKEEVNPSVEIKSCPYKLNISGRCVSLEWKILPPEETYGKFLIKFWRPSSVGEIEVLEEIKEEVFPYLKMPSMGHGSSPMTVKKIGVGTYEVTEVFFSMPGDWDIHIQLKINGEKYEETVIPYTF